MKRCTACSQPLDGFDDSAHCPACGTVLDKPKPKPKPVAKKKATAKKASVKKTTKKR